MWMVHTSQANMLLFAQPGPTDWDLCLAAGALFGVLALGYWAILKVKRWRDQTKDSDILTPEQILEHCQKLVEEGLLDPKELSQIQSRLEGGDDLSPSPKQLDPPSSLQPPTDSTPEK